MRKSSRRSIKSAGSIGSKTARSIRSRTYKSNQKSMAKSKIPPLAKTVTNPIKKNKIDNDTMSTFITIYRKTISNLKIREDILRSIGDPKYKVGPTIIWTEVPEDLSIFTTDESYDNYIGFEDEFANPRSKKYLKTILKTMRMTQGTILIKEESESDSMNIPVHFCAYRVDDKGTLTIFDPSWHSEDPGIYSTTAFYDSLDAFKIEYQHAEQKRRHHWQSLLINDVFCQTWTLKWLLSDDTRDFPLPPKRIDAAEHVAKYMKEFSRIILKNIEKYMSMFPKYKLDGQDPSNVFTTIVNKHDLKSIINDMV